MEKQIEPFLPTASEIEEMSNEEFEAWALKAKRELIKRAEKRNPLFYLKKRISSILIDTRLSEEQREARILHEIERYERIISRPQ